jgi:hypothetical protein
LCNLTGHHAHNIHRLLGRQLTTTRVNPSGWDT